MLLLAEIAKLGQDELQKGLVKTFNRIDPLYSLLPFVDFEGKAYAWNEAATSGGIIVGPRGQSLTGSDSAATFTPKTAVPSTFIAKYSMAGEDVKQGIGANRGNDPREIQMDLKTEAIAREYARLIIAGNATTPGTNVTGVTNNGEFDGLINLAAYSNVAADAAAFSLSTLDSLVLSMDAVDVLVMTPNMLAKLKNAARTAGGTDQVQIGGHTVQSFGGIPVITSRFIPVASGASAVFSVKVNRDGAGGLTGLIPVKGSVDYHDLGMSESAYEYKYMIAFQGGLICPNASKTVKAVWIDE